MSATVPLSKGLVRCLICQCIITVCVVRLCYACQRTETYLPAVAERIKKRPVRYIEIGTRSPFPRYWNQWIYIYTVEGREHQGLPLDAYREEASRSMHSAVVFYAPNTPGKFLVRKRPYIDKRCGTLVLFLGLLMPVLVFCGNSGGARERERTQRAKRGRSS